MALDIFSVIPGATEIHPVTIAARQAEADIAKLFVEQDESARIAAMAAGDSRPAGLIDKELTTAMHASGDSRDARNFDTHAKEVREVLRELHNVLTENKLTPANITKLEHKVVESAAEVANAQLAAGMLR